MPKGCRHDGTLLQDECGCGMFGHHIAGQARKTAREDAERAAETPRRRPRTLRRFVERGGQLVEVESVVRETR